MTTNFDRALQQVSALADDFEANESGYLSPSYQEAQVRLDFIDKFLKALGWDVDHVTQKNPYEQEVRVERGVGVSGRKKRCDYAFYLAPNFRDEIFFVEAKKPSIDLPNADDLFQTIRYAWAKNAPLSIITSFRALHILDCRVPPDISTALNRSMQSFSFRDYRDPERFGRIYWLFSREAVSTGKLDAYLAQLPSPKKRRRESTRDSASPHPIDQTFLAQLDDFRLKLARAFKLANPRLDSSALTEASQRTLDRLIFIRFLEDKLIEPELLLAPLGEKSSHWRDFVALSHRLDGRYNGIVFKHHFVDDADFRDPGAPFAQICSVLADPHSPYNFDAIGIDILGSVYERFLGKVVVAREKTADIEEKPEVRKAGGVYYTPQYIVRHIVRSSVGKLVAGKNPEQIAKMRFLDLSCGSGSFLLGVYAYLLDYHQRYFARLPNQAAPGDLVENAGRRVLSLRRKQQILLNNIFGVDLDPQAVEVTQLSLYLKLLEDETTASARQAHLDFKEALLPSLGRNIFCANGIVSTDLDGLSGEQERVVRPTDLRALFRHKRLGDQFDAIVGNPPWGAEVPPIVARYLARRFEHVIVRMPDSYIYFVAASLELLRPNGFLGMILPSTLLTQTDAARLRETLLETTALHEVINLGERVFGKNVLNTSSILVGRKASDWLPRMAVADLRNVPSESKATALAAVVPGEKSDAWLRIVRADPEKTFFTRDLDVVRTLQRLQRDHAPLAAIVDGKIERGVTPDLLEMSVIPSVVVRREHLETEPLRPIVLGENVSRYILIPPTNFVAYLGHHDDISLYPRLKAYMAQFRQKIGCPEVRDGRHEWYALHRTRDESIFTRPKFIGLTTTPPRKIKVAYDEDGAAFATDALYLFALKSDAQVPVEVLLAVLHSRCFGALYAALVQGEQRVIPQIKASKLGLVPFPSPPYPTDVVDALLREVGSIQTILRKRASTTSDADRSYSDNRIIGHQERIEPLVHRLYRLTAREARTLEAEPEEFTPTDGQPKSEDA